MELEELLALFPDNSVGAIDAEDIRTAITELWTYTSNVQATLNQVVVDGVNAANLRVEQTDARISALEAAGVTPSISVSGRWQVNPNVGTEPGGMQVTTDSVVLSEVTWARFATVDQANTDMAATMMQASTVFVQQQSESGNWARYRVEGTPTDHGTYVELPVTYIRGEGSPDTVGWQTVIAVFNVPMEPAALEDLVR